MATCACPDCLEELHEHCTCLDCHAKLYAAHGSCSCSLCADRYRSEVRAALAPVRSIFAMMTPVGSKDAGAVQPSTSASRASGGDAVRLGIPGVLGTPASFLPTAPTPRQAGDSLQEPAPAVESVAAGDEVR